MFNGFSFTSADNFWTMKARALIFHMNIPTGKTFPWVPTSLTFWPWPMIVWPIFENYNPVNTFWEVSAKALIQELTFLVIRSSCWYLTFWPWHLKFFFLKLMLNNKYKSFRIPQDHFLWQYLFTELRSRM